MEFEILSHAGLRVEHSGTRLIVDPWLVGSAYWRSWWNYPPIDPARARTLDAQYVYLTHIHWDHFHGPSLRALGKEVQLLIPEDRYERLRRDLRDMGFRRITEIPHGSRFELGPDFAITPFIFFPFTDSMLAIRGGQTVVLNANDCKMCGLPLRQVKRAFPKIDFVLRSHSSANTRVCREYLDEPSQEYDRVDNKEDYLRSFSHFMTAMKPKYAIPFASNHCHLHKDARRFNRWQQTPRDVRDYFEAYRVRTGLDTQLVTMLPGSRWHDVDGFDLSSEAPWFEDREARIEEYAQANQTRLDEYYALESRSRVTLKDMKFYFERLHRHVPRVLRKRFAGRPVFFKSTSGEREDLWKVDLHADVVAAASAEEYAASDMRIEMPAMVMRQALRMNMFSHTGISKRVRWIATKEAMGLLGFFMLMMDFEEYEVIPLRRNFSARSIRVWLRRWREVLGYAQLIWIMKSRGISGKEVEQVALLEYS